jgi:hypothetical protein
MCIKKSPTHDDSYKTAAILSVLYASEHLIRLKNANHISHFFLTTLSILGAGGGSTHALRNCKMNCHAAVPHT